MSLVLLYLDRFLFWGAILFLVFGFIQIYRHDIAETREESIDAGKSAMAWVTCSVIFGLLDALVFFIKTVRGA